MTMNVNTPYAPPKVNDGAQQTLISLLTLANAIELGVKIITSAQTNAIADTLGGETITADALRLRIAANLTSN